MLKSGLYEMLVAAPSIQAILTSGQAGNSVHFTRAPKQPLTPYIIIHLPDVPPAEATFDGISALIEGMIQFDCYAKDVNGSIVCQKLAQAVRALFAGFSGTLNDGTTISFVDLIADFDDGYEVGGEDFLFRWVTRFRAFYTEAP